MDHFCPQCGFNMGKDTAVERDGWSIDVANGMVVYGGKPLRFTAAERLLLHTLASSSRLVTKQTLVDRISENSDVLPQIVNVRVSMINKKLRAADIPSPIENVWGLGLRWSVAG